MPVLNLNYSAFFFHVTYRPRVTGNIVGSTVESFVFILVQIGRLKEMVAIGMNVDLLQRNGILVDTEQDDDGQGNGSREGDPALLPKNDR